MTDESKALNAAVFSIAFVLVSQLSVGREPNYGKIAVGGTVYLLGLSLLNSYDSRLAWKFSLLVLLATCLSQSPAVYRKITGGMS